LPIAERLCSNWDEMMKWKCVTHMDLDVRVVTWRMRSGLASLYIWGKEDGPLKPRGFTGALERGAD